ncbi:alpha-2-macroglobulin family protein [Lysobacter brunescens]|uniref:MG2 domain-containing protein n=1 Tax=Lysobacter brunescens TaxID=262323 RepID=A0ABW2YAD7_9GAMM
MLLAALCLPAMVLPVKGLAADPTRGIQVDVEDDGFSLEFPEPMLALDNQPVTGLRVEPALALDCHWSDDTEIGCTVAGGKPLPPATRLTIRLAPGLQTASGKPLGAVVLTVETERPELDASVTDWKAGVPSLVLEGNLPMTAEAVARVLSLGDGERIWRGLRVSPLPGRRHWNGRERPRFAVTLPPDLPTDAVIDVVADAGLRSSAGPLPSDEPGRLLLFRHAEPFRVRAATCASREREARDLQPADGLSLDCVPGRSIAIHFSATLQADARAAFVAALPTGVVLSRWVTASAPVESDARVSQGDGDVASLVIDAPDTRIAFDIDGGLRDVDARRLSAPTRVELRTGAPRPALRAPATRWLLGDPDRAGIEAVNAPALTLDIDGLGAGPLRERLGIASTRGTAATAVSASARRTLGEGGTLRWQLGPHSWEALRMAAPQFDLGAQVAGSEVVAWALDWDDSRSLDGVEVELVRLAPAAKEDPASMPTETVVGTARTGRDGVARLVLPADFARAPKTRGTPPASWFLRATDRARRAVLHLGEDGNGGLARVSTTRPRLFVATDRPLYRAGDTVRFHGWVRVGRGGRLLRPEDKAVALSLVSDAQRTELLTWRGTLDDGGAFAGEFVLPSQTVDGDYCFRLDEGEHAACIFVGTFRAQDLWAQAETTTPLVRDGDRIALDIEAGYWSGGAASGAEIRRVRTFMEAASPADAYPAFADYAFLDASADDVHARFAPPAAATGTLDADGRARVEIPVAFVDDEAETPAQPPAFARLQTTAEIALAGREPVVSNGATVHYARHARYVGLRLLPAWFDAATPLRLDAVLVAADGTAVPGETITVTVVRRSEQVDGTTQDEPVATCTLVAGTPAPCDVPRTRSGRYVFTARSGDAAPAVLTRYVWNARGARGEAPAIESALEVIAAPADASAPVRLLLRQPYARADALLVVSAGGEVLATRTLAIDRAETELTLPTHADGRNRVDMTLRVRERAPAPVDAEGLRKAPRSTTLTVAVDVPRPERKPAVALSLDRIRTEPGQPVQVRVRNNGPTPRTVALAVFDDALRSLAGARWDDFDPHGAAWLGSRDADWRGRLHVIDYAGWNKAPWTHWLPWDDAKVEASLRGPASARAVMRLREAEIRRSTEVVAPDFPEEPPVVFDAASEVDSPASPGMGYAGETDDLDRIAVTGSRILRAQDIGPVADLLYIVKPDPGATRRERAPPPDPALLALRVRGAFADTALWQGGLRLAPGEERVFTVTAPDNLTRWRAVAWSADDGEGFDRAEAMFDVGLPLEARLDAPVRLYPGDRAELTANVRQSGDAPLRVDARLAVEALGAQADATLDLAARGQSSFVLDIAPGAEATPRMLVATAHAHGGAHGDAVSQAIELASPSIDARRVQAGWLGASPLLLPMPTLPAGARDVRLSVSLLPGADALVHGWIDDLHRYPHRCWEQMLSRAVAAAIALERGEGARFPDARASIDDALANVAVFQTGDGGFRYFADTSDDDGGDVPLTAWTVRVLRTLADLGHDVPLRALSKADGYLQRRVHPSGSDPVTRVRVAFAAAAQEKPGFAVTDGLWREFATLPLPAQVAAARAMAAGRHPQARDAARRLLDATTLRGKARVLRAPGRHDRWMSSDLREQCELIALLRRHPSFADTVTRRALIAGLGDLYAGGVPEVDTQSGAVCLLALRGLGRDGTRTPVTLDLSLGDRRTTLALAPGGEPPRWDLAIEPREAGQPLRLTPQVGGDVPASYRVEYRYSEDARAANASAIGFALQREYRMLRDGRWQPLAGESLRDGDWVRVTLRLDTRADRHFVAITDAVPGGLRPTDLTLSGVAGVDLQAVSDEGSGWFRTRRLDPRAPKFYAKVLPAGRHEVHYFARVGNAGDYLAAPAQAELMYGAATRARTAATRVVIEGGAPDR